MGEDIDGIHRYIGRSGYNPIDNLIDMEQDNAPDNARYIQGNKSDDFRIKGIKWQM